jgi:acyl dehydratase
MPEYQRRFEDVTVGDRLPGATYPLPLYRLVMAAGATRDFTAIHHNDEYARAAGAPSTYANTILLMGMWERVLRDYIGLAGTIRAIRNFRMVRFTTVGSLVRVEGQVVSKEQRDGRPLVGIELRTMVGETLTVGPGLAEVTLP